jgi:GTP-binding protein EngB required for normal cell division
MEINCPNFIEALTLETHPMKWAKSKLKMQYYIGLESLIGQIENDDEYISTRVAQYNAFLVGDAIIPKMTVKARNDITRSVINSTFRPWRKKYRYWQLCDIALILIHENKIQKAATILKGYLNKRQASLLDVLLTTLFTNEEIPEAIAFAADLIEQFRSNRNFAAKPEKRFVVTANISAGKSTLINAMIGKPLTRTSKATCTVNLCYLYNKPFEDNAVHLSTSPLNLNARYNDLVNSDFSAVSSIASHFRMTAPQIRICIIDTPGVNCTINRHHKKITRTVLKEEMYDSLIYVLNANKLGTDEEKEHLQWVSENVPKQKVVFVLNKLDDFKSVDDSIEESIEGVKSDLLAIGYEKPLICPLSAYFAFLIKLKANGERMTEDETDAYNLYLKKFSKEEYDLSKYFDGVISNKDDSESIRLSKKCGLYGLEQILFGKEFL